MRAIAYAKLNLTLDVLGRREDGYHDLAMVMQTVDLHDDLELSFEGDGFRAVTNLDYLPTDGGNLAVAAARIFCQETGCKVDGLTIKTHKRIPVCAGMAGGSSDAAAVLRALNRYTGAGLSDRRLRELGELVGSDVPYCVTGGTMLAEGRGERLTPLPPMPRCHVAICKPNFSVSTPELFGRIDCKKLRRRPDTAGMIEALASKDLVQISRRLYNVFEDVLLPRQQSEVAAIKSAMLSEGALGSAMTGTGPTVFGLFDCREKAAAACEALGGQYNNTFLAQIV